MIPSDPSSINLKGLLESQNVTKIIYDVRSDSSNLLRQVRLFGLTLTVMKVCDV